MKRPFHFIRAFDHRMREAWRYYRCAVEFFGPKSPETCRIRRNIRANLIETI